ncbi:hypothetical protein WA026_009972 [Henosepilachna vigintioctopunctata]|uniref:ABC transporter domain-containing protein n=1 Tax=Henosepilachna vigintioctopunctata TaxID=420089 RepID=A0AAW1TRV1_9CUCU
MKTIVVHNDPVLYYKSFKIVRSRNAVYNGTMHISSKLILRGVSGKFVSGQLTAILGPSGSGKSSLLNILAAYKSEGTTGNILVNGKTRNEKNFRKISRYIMQDDYVQPYLTVQESMVIAANLKLGSCETAEKKEIMIAEILDLLRLNLCKNTLAKGLSGGEKKRLSIALEMLNNPAVIFLDEPTTGLDDVACSQCIGLLKLLAELGRTVICAVHTPSAKLFSIFDNVYIVSQGQCVYQGYGPSVVPFLASIGLVCPLSYSPADFMMEVCSKEYGDFHNKMVSIVENGHNMVDNKERRTSTGQTDSTAMDEIEDISDSNQKYVNMDETGSTFFDKYLILSERLWIQIWRDKSSLLMKCIVYLFLSLLYGNIFIGIGNDGSKTLYNFGLFYLCIIFYMYIPMMPVLLWFPQEIKILKREHFNKWYGLAPYYLALTVTSIPIQMVLTFVFTGITYTLTDQPIEIDRMLLFYFICVLTGLVAESLGILIGALCDITNALFIGTCVKIPMMLLATHGYGYGGEAMPQWIRIAMRFMYLRYSMEGISGVMLRNRLPVPCPEEKDLCIYTDLNYFLHIMGMSDAVLWIDIVALIVFLFIFKAAGYYVLLQRLSPNKMSRTVNVVVKLVKSHFGP